VDACESSKIIECWNADCHDTLVASPDALVRYFKLQSTENERDLEQDLLALVDYDKFSLVKQLIRNRATIVWCTLLARAENADVEKRIEVRRQHLGQPWCAGRCVVSQAVQHTNSTVSRPKL
jgi:hypothetical protein